MRKLVLAACATLLVGCATANSVNYSAINAPPRPFVRRDPSTVDVFVSKPPARPYVEVGLFEVYQGTTDDGVRRSTEDMIGTLRVHGGLRGCDAVQVLGVELAEAGYRYHQAQSVVRGVCVLYTDEQARLADSQRAPLPPLPSEGKSCTTQANHEAPMSPCPDPLVCVNRVCASPYR